MFFYLHLASKGYAVMSLGATVPLSNCHTERTSGDRPSGAGASHFLGAYFWEA
jgi:hypothetical protein